MSSKDDANNLGIEQGIWHEIKVKEPKMYYWRDRWLFAVIYGFTVTSFHEK